MKTILQINSSISSGNGEPTRLAEEFVYAEGLAMGEEPKPEGLASARRIIQGFVNELKIAA